MRYAYGCTGLIRLSSHLYMLLPRKNAIANQPNAAVTVDVELVFPVKAVVCGCDK